MARASRKLNKLYPLLRSYSKLKSIEAETRSLRYGTTNGIKSNQKSWKYLDQKVRGNSLLILEKWRYTK